MSLSYFAVIIPSDKSADKSIAEFSRLGSKPEIGQVFNGLGRVQCVFDTRTDALEYIEECKDTLYEKLSACEDREGSSNDAACRTGDYE